VAIILLAIYVSFYVVITAGILVITLPLAAMIGKRFGIFRGQIQAQGDKRLKLTNELLQGIRIVKYYAWEHAFQANIESYRVKELDRVKALSLNRSALIFMMQNATTVALGVTLVCTMALWCTRDLTLVRRSFMGSMVRVESLKPMPSHWLQFSILFDKHLFCFQCPSRSCNNT
jgi:hypothetical protein